MGRRKKHDYGPRWRDDPKLYSQLHRQHNPVMYLINQARYRAKKNGMDFDLTLSDLVVPDVCPVLGIPLMYTKGKRTDNSYSLDRVDNSRGYTKDNVRVISNRANRLKSDLTIEELKALMQYMES